MSYPISDGPSSPNSLSDLGPTLLFLIIQHSRDPPGMLQMQDHCILSSPALPLTPLMWLTHSPLSDLCPNVTFSWNLSWSLYPMLQHPESSFLCFFTIFHTLYILLFVYCPSLSTRMQTPPKEGFWRATLFTTELPAPRKVFVLWYMLSKYLQNEWINVYLSKY